MIKAKPLFIRSLYFSMDIENLEDKLSNQITVMQKMKEEKEQEIIQKNKKISKLEGRISCSSSLYTEFFLSRDPL